VDQRQPPGIMPVTCFKESRLARTADRDGAVTRLLRRFPSAPTERRTILYDAGTFLPRNSVDSLLKGLRIMNSTSSRAAMSLAALLLGTGAAHAAGYLQTIASFKNSARSADFFENSYAYAVFPAVGKGSFIIGAAHGDGRVYTHGLPVGIAALTQFSVGLQAGVAAYSEIIFFQDQQALDAFESGNFQFGAGVSAVVITAGASASADTSGTQASASGGQDAARVAGAYNKGIVVFTIVRGGIEGGASVQGEKFSYRAGP
jgi:lipid-binding SYLF domain-containing protein